MTLTNDFTADILTLARHGARLGDAGQSIPLTVEFYRDAVASMAGTATNAITYAMILPGLDGDFRLTIHADGTVWSGSAEFIDRLLNTLH